MRRALFALIIGALAGAGAAPADRPLTRPTGTPSEVTVPFELINRKVFLPVRVGDSRPLWFVLDTGAPSAIIDLDLARELGVELGGEVRVGGGGAQTSSGAFVKSSALTVIGMAGFSQPLKLAIPMRSLTPRLGHDLDGILGAEFIARFVLELDYEARRIRLHDKDTFSYAGPGQSIPIRRSHGHPILEAEVTPIGRESVKGDFVLDIGSGGALALYSPFVTEQRLLGPDLKTIKAIGVRGAGGEMSGRVGRVASLKIGRFTINEPITHFSQDRAGAFANPAIQGNIGHRIASRFKLFLDYQNDRIIFEPNGRFAEPSDRASSGLALTTEGKDYKTFRVTDVLEESPASEAGLRPDDVITAIGERAASALTLGEVLEMLELPVPYRLTVRRGERTLEVTLKPRQLVRWSPSRDATDRTKLAQMA
jgi:hypothetical protein